jgi:DHA2 family multidrug resistance protein
MNQTPSTEWHPRFNPWLISLPLMLATFMFFLDTSIVVVSLPYVAGNLGSTQDESTWVLTSYLVANAIILPASAKLANFFGRKRFLIGCTIVFTLSSLLCGVAVSMPMLVISRVLQGLGGGAMHPLTQSILLESFPPNKRGIASALYGLGIVVAPIIGPTLGGWLTDAYSWRWTFFINLPVGILAVFLMTVLIEDPPYIKFVKVGKIDVLGFTLMALFLGTLQIILDKGQDADWFSAVWLRWFAVISAASLIGFIWRELTTDNPIVDLRIFKNRNFAVSSIMFGLFGMMIYALITLQPLFLQSMLGYTAFDAGLSVTPRGLGSLVALFFVGALSSRLNPKILVGFGFMANAVGAFMLSGLSLQMSMSNILWANIIAGLGASSIFVPLTTLAVGTLRNEQIANAIGLSNLVRNIGSSIGLSLVATMLERLSQTHQSMMVGYLSAADPQYNQALDGIQRIFAQRFSPVDALNHAQGFLYRILIQQSDYWSFVNLFYFVACLCVVCLLGVFVFQTPRTPVMAAVAAE